MMNPSCKSRSRSRYHSSSNEAWASPPRGVGGTMSPSLMRHVPRRVCNKIQIRLYILTSLGVHVHKIFCFKLFPAEIDGIRSGYYNARNALKPTYSHLRSQNFLGKKQNPRTPTSRPRGTTRTPIQMSSCAWHRSIVMWTTASVSL